MLKLFFKQLFCTHKNKKLNRWHICHGPMGNNPAEVEAEYICQSCGALIYGHDSIRNIAKYEAICRNYDRILEEDD